MDISETEQDCTLPPYNLPYTFSCLQSTTNVFASFSRIFNLAPKKTSVPICNCQISQEEISVKCYTCQVHPQSVICGQCFLKGNHQGHRYVIKHGAGGCCDCGNSAAIAPKGFCSDHVGVRNRDQDPNEEFIQGFIRSIGAAFAWGVKNIAQPVVMAQRGSIPLKGGFLLKGLVMYLEKLNDRSSYYNVATGRLFSASAKTLEFTRSKADSSQTFLEWLIGKIYSLSTFQEYRLQVGRQLQELLFKLFSVKQFKIQLACIYTYLDNRLPLFVQFMPSLFMQLFGTGSISQTMSDMGVCLSPQVNESTINFHLTFLCSLEPKQIPTAYMAMYFSRYKLAYSYIPPEVSSLAQIVTHFQLEEELQFYSLLVSLSNLFDHSLLSKVCCDYVNLLAINPLKKGNKIVLPYHRAMIIFLTKAFGHELQAYRIEEVSKFLNIPIIQVQDILMRLFTDLCECIGEFSKSFWGASYFQHYVIYTKIMVPVCNYDFAGVKVAYHILKQTEGGIHFVNRYFMGKLMAPSIQTVSSESTPQMMDPILVTFLELILSQCLSPRSLLFVTSHNSHHRNEKEVVVKSLLDEIFPLVEELNLDVISQVKRYYDQDFSSSQLLDWFIWDDDQQTHRVNPAKRKLVKQNSQEGVPGMEVNQEECHQYTFLEDRLLFNIFKLKTIQSVPVQYVRLRPQAQHPFDEEVLVKMIEASRNGGKEIEQAIERIVRIANLITKSQQVQLKLIQLCGQKVQLLQNQNATFSLRKIKKVQNFKKQQRNKFMDQAMSLGDSDKEEAVQTEISPCIFCHQHPNRPKVYLVKAARTTNLSLFLDLPDSLTVVACCQHQIHVECLQKLTASHHDPLICPLCKAAWNFALPVPSFSFGRNEIIENQIQSPNRKAIHSENANQIFLQLTNQQEFPKLIKTFIRSIIQRFLAILWIGSCESENIRQLKFTLNYLLAMRSHQQFGKVIRQLELALKVPVTGPADQVIALIFYKLTEPIQLGPKMTIRLSSRDVSTLRGLLDLLGSDLANIILEEDPKVKPLNNSEQLLSNIPHDPSSMILLRDTVTTEQRRLHMVAMCMTCLKTFCRCCVTGMQEHMVNVHKMSPFLCLEFDRAKILLLVGRPNLGIAIRMQRQLYRNPAGMGWNLSEAIKDQTLNINLLNKQLKALVSGEEEIKEIFQGQGKNRLEQWKVIVEGIA